ncbi:MAG: hypothetical protein WD768_03910 [Phycisphaeraceae bacterium]
MFSQLLAIFRNTFVESIRQPIAIVVIIACNLVLALCVAGAGYTMDDDNLLFIPLGLSTLLLGGLFLAGFTATGVVSLEIENKTALTVVSKPVTRPLFILGKYLGVAGALLMAMWPMICTLLLCVRHGVMQTASTSYDGPVILFGLLAFFGALFVGLMVNYLYRWPFVSTFIWMFNATMTLALILVLVVDKEWHLQSITTEFTNHESPIARFAVAILLLIETLLIFCAIAVALSTRLGQVMTILIMIGVSVVISALGPFYANAARDAGSGDLLIEGKRVVASVMYHVMPVLDFLWVADDLSAGIAVSGTYVLTVSLYSGLLIVALLGIAVALFQTREVG